MTSAGFACSGFLLGMYIDDALDNVLRGEFDPVDVGEEFSLGVLLLVPLVKVCVGEVLPLPVSLWGGSGPGSIVASSLMLSAVE